MTKRWTIEQKTQVGTGAYTYQNVEVVLASDYDQELANAKHDIERLQAAASAEANEVERRRATLQRIEQERLTWAMTCQCYCPACKALDKLIRFAVPQDGKHD